MQSGPVSGETLVRGGTAAGQDPRSSSAPGVLGSNLGPDQAQLLHDQLGPGVTRSYFTRPTFAQRRGLPARGQPRAT